MRIVTVRREVVENLLLNSWKARTEMEDWHRGGVTDLFLLRRMGEEAPKDCSDISHWLVFDPNAEPVDQRGIDISSSISRAVTIPDRR